MGTIHQTFIFLLIFLTLNSIRRLEGKPTETEYYEKLQKQFDISFSDAELCLLTLAKSVKTANPSRGNEFSLAMSPLLAAKATAKSAIQKRIMEKNLSMESALEIVRPLEIEYQNFEKKEVVKPYQRQVKSCHQAVYVNALKIAEIFKEGYETKS